MIPKIQVSGHNGRRQTFLLLRLSEQLRLVGVRPVSYTHLDVYKRQQQIHRVEDDIVEVQRIGVP